MNTANGAIGISAFLTDTIKYVCDTFKKRAPGTKAERASQEYFAKILRPYADEVKVERFVFHPSAFNGSLIAGGILSLLSAVLTILAATAGTVRFAGITAFIFLLAALAITASEFVLCSQIFDFLFPRRISKNVYAVRKAEDRIKRRIIIAAHADAPGELLLGTKALKKLNKPILLIYGAGTLVSFIVSAVYLFSKCPPVKGGWILYPVIICLFIPVWLVVIFLRKPGKTVDGACSCAAGCAVAAGVLKTLAENDERFRNTEVCCLITGAHNSGCRGAKAFAKAHKKELSDVPTYVIPIGSVSAGRYFTVFSLDRCATVRNSMDCAEHIILSGREAGTDIAHADFALRCTDAAAFTAAGIPACTIETGERADVSPCETKADNWRCVSPSAAETMLDICLGCVRKFNEQSVSSD